jgi:hypothetical protein
MSDKGSRGRSGRAPRTVREDAIIHFTEPVTFGPRLVSDGAWFSIERSVVDTCVFALVLSEAHPSVADGPPQGPGWSALSLFFQKASPVRNI